MNEFTGLTSSGSQPHAGKLVDINTFPHGAGNIPGVPVPNSYYFPIRTVAAPGDYVFLLCDNRVVRRKVCAIRVHIVLPSSAVRANPEIKVELNLERVNGVTEWHTQEGRCFSTKEELLASL